MKKAILLSITIHLIFIFSILKNPEGKKKNMENVYIVDLLNLPSSIEISNSPIAGNVISSFKPEPAEASIVTQPQRVGSSIKTTSPVSGKTHIGSGGTGTSGEKFSAEEYISDINRRLTQYGSNQSTDGISSEKTSQKSGTTSGKKQSLASRIFPLNQKEQPPGMSVGFQGSSIPAGNIIPLEYLDEIKIAIQRKWKLPPGEKNYSLSSVVSFKLHKDGTITDISLESTSGVKEFDESAIRAVKETGRLSPLPDTYRLDSLEVAVKFNARGIE